MRKTYLIFLKVRLPECLQGVVPACNPWVAGTGDVLWVLSDARGIEMMKIRKPYDTAIYVVQRTNPWVLGDPDLNRCEALQYMCHNPTRMLDSDTIAGIVEDDVNRLIRVIRNDWFEHAL